MLTIFGFGASHAQVSTRRLIGKTAKEMFDETAKRLNAAPGDPMITITADTAAVKKERPQLTNGKRLVLSIPIQITNRTKNRITATLAHEWYGGISPLTDLQIAVLHQTASAEYWRIGPGYQVNERGETNTTKLDPGESIEINIRLNWPGTGSQPTEPLIDETVPGKYPVRAMFFYRQNNRRFVVYADLGLLET